MMLRLAQMMPTMKWSAPTREYDRLTGHCICNLNFAGVSATGLPVRMIATVMAYVVTQPAAVKMRFTLCKAIHHTYDAPWDQ